MRKNIGNGVTRTELLEHGLEAIWLALVCLRNAANFSERNLPSGPFFGAAACEHRIEGSSAVCVLTQKVSDHPIELALGSATLASATSAHGLAFRS